MGSIWLNDIEVGIFQPQIEGTNGDVLLNGNVVGSFSLSISGSIYLNNTIIGTYTAISAILAIPQIRAEIFRGPPALMDDNFVKGWTLTTGGTSSFSTDGDIATVQSGDQTYGWVEKNLANINTNIYPKCAVRIPSDSGAWTVKIYYDEAWHAVWGPGATETGLLEVTFPAGKTLTKIAIISEGLGIIAKFDYLAICKDTILIPVDTSLVPGSKYEAESGLTITRPLLELGVAGAQLSFPNLGGAYVGKINKFDRILIYLWRKGTLMKKRFGGKITDRGTSGRLTEFYMNLKCMGLGEQLHAPESLIQKKYSQTAGKIIITEAIAKCSTLTDKFVDADNEIASSHDFEIDEVLPFEVINKICKEAHTSAAVIGFDGYVDPAGNVHVFKREKYTSSISLQIEEYSRSRDMHQARNTIIVYGKEEKSLPLDKDIDTETDTSKWAGPGASWNEDDPQVGSKSLQFTANDVSSIDIFQLLAGLNEEIDCAAWKRQAYKILHFWIQIVTAPNPDGETSIYLQAYAPNIDNRFGYFLTTPANKRIAGEGRWYEFYIPLGPYADGWFTLTGSPDWSQVERFRFYISGINTGTITVRFDGWYVGRARFRSEAADSGSIGSYKTRYGLPQVDDRLASDEECQLKAQSLLEVLKEEVESFRLLRTEGSDFTPGDRQRVIIPNDNINNYQRILEIQDIVEGTNWDSVLKVSNKPRMIDYVTFHKAQLIVQAIEEERSH